MNYKIRSTVNHKPVKSQALCFAHDGFAVAGAAGKKSNVETNYCPWTMEVSFQNTQQGV